MTPGTKPTWFGTQTTACFVYATFGLMLFFTTVRGVGTSTHSPSTIAITHVTVIDVEKGLRLDDQTVLVVGNQVNTVATSSSVALKSGVTVVDGRGKFLIPG